MSIKQKGETPTAKDMNMREMGMSREMGMNGRGGHLYMQTNEIKNAITHYRFPALP